MFDKVEVVVKGGNGGAGVVSFRREKYIPYGGPDGGDGGNGGHVILMTDESINTLRPFERKRLYKAADGKKGMGTKKHGKQGEDLILKVPIGTLVWDNTNAGSGVLIADLEEPGQQVVIARGGKGGWGNTHYTSSTNQAPRLAQNGGIGEENHILLELRLIADAGIIGYPNAGKSTLLSAASEAKPKIASYPFTTLEPVLGVVEVGSERFVLAEIPGIIEEAHLGRGLGLDFLRHAMRTRLLIHLVDGSSSDPMEDLRRVNGELKYFDASLAEKPQLVAVNKVDLPEVQKRLDEIRNAFGNSGVVPHFISAATGEGVVELMAEARNMLGRMATKAAAGEKVPPKVFRPQPKGAGISVHKEGDTFVIMAPEVERIVSRVDMTVPEIRWQLQKQLDRLGVSRALDKAGAKAGDKVRCGKSEWEW